MLNTRKLLYILPDVAYIAELLPAKKEHTFTVQAFRQINGEFFDQEEEAFIADNIEKLFSKIEPENYYLILPDFLFTNTILEVRETNENKVKDYIKDELLPKLGLTKDTHEIETFSLTQYNGATKIQLTALERSILDPIVTSSQNHHITIDHISPLTWTIKSIISLEPSISVLQIGTLVYVAEHYIGVDQCTMSKVEEIENVVDTIKTLKGSQPSIQTVYLLTNALVEQKLKEHVSSTLPLQQLTNATDEDSQMPSYVKQIIESGMKTLDIPDFPVPSFILPKHTSGVPSTNVASTDSETEPKPVETSLPEPKIPDSAASVASLPTPKPPLAVPVPVAPVPLMAAAAAPILQAPTMTSITTHRDTIDIEEDEGEPAISAHSEDVTTKVLTMPLDQTHAAETMPPSPNRSETWASTINSSNNSSPASVYVPPAAPQLSSLTTPETDTPWGQPTPVAQKPSSSMESTSSPVKNWSLPESTSQTTTPEFKSSSPRFSSESLNSSSSVKADDSIIAKIAGANDRNFDHSSEEAAMETDSFEPERPIIKNKDNGSSLLKMAFVSLAVFALTVAVGVGIGFGILSLNNRSQSSDLASPIVSTPPEASAIPTPSPTPEASSSATLDKKTTKILVVNATTTPGYAGTTGSKLKAAGYPLVTTGNAKGTYDPGFYILTVSEDPGTTTAMSEASGLTLTYQATKDTEDPSNQYDIVIVLAK